MKMTNRRKGKLCFEENENTKRADEAFRSTMKKFMLDIDIGGYTWGYDEDNGDILYFFPLFEISTWKEEDRERYFAVAIKNWKDANFEIAEQKELSGGEYFHVGFDSLFFRLKSLI